MSAEAAFLAMLIGAGLLYLASLMLPDEPDEIGGRRRADGVAIVGGLFLVIGHVLWICGAFALIWDGARAVI